MDIVSTLVSHSSEHLDKLSEVIEKMQSKNLDVELNSYSDSTRHHTLVIGREKDV